MLYDQSAAFNEPAKDMYLSAEDEPLGDAHPIIIGITGGKQARRERQQGEQAENNRAAVDGWSA